MHGQLKEIMRDYLEDTGGNSRRLLPESMVMTVQSPMCPIKPTQKSEWEVVSDPNRLMKTFEFESYIEMKAFVSELMSYQEQVGHHAKLTVNYRDVIVEVYTHDVNDVTELDQEYAQSADQIHQDVQFYFMEERDGPVGEY
jgi:4a-hydroxytetrahydrobiopterin dehydratase